MLSDQASQNLWDAFLSGVIPGTLCVLSRLSNAGPKGTDNPISISFSYQSTRHHMGQASRGWAVRIQNNRLTTTPRPPHLCKYRCRPAGSFAFCLQRCGLWEACACSSGALWWMLWKFSSLRGSFGFSWWELALLSIGFAPGRSRSRELFWCGLRRSVTDWYVLTLSSGEWFLFAELHLFLSQSESGRLWYSCRLASFHIDCLVHIWLELS